MLTDECKKICDNYLKSSLGAYKWVAGNSIASCCGAQYGILDHPIGISVAINKQPIEELLEGKKLLDLPANSPITNQSFKFDDLYLNLRLQHVGVGTEWILPISEPRLIERSEYPADMATIYSGYFVELFSRASISDATIYGSKQIPLTEELKLEMWEYIKSKLNGYYIVILKNDSTIYDYVRELYKDNVIFTSETFTNLGYGGKVNNLQLYFLKF